MSEYLYIPNVQPQCHCRATIIEHQPLTPSYFAAGPKLLHSIIHLLNLTRNSKTLDYVLKPGSAECKKLSKLRNPRLLDPSPMKLLSTILSMSRPNNFPPEHARQLVLKLLGGFGSGLKVDKMDWSRRSPWTCRYIHINHTRSREP